MNYLTRLMAFTLVLLVASAGRAENYKDVFPDTPDPFLGDYEGRWSADEDVDPEMAAQIFPLGGDLYRVILVNRLHLRYPLLGVYEIGPKEGMLKFEDEKFFGETDGKTMTGGRKGSPKTFKIERVHPTPPTLGATPPQNAVVLFDGKNLDAFEAPNNWQVLDGGVMMVTPDSKDLLSKKKFKNLQMHVEFRLPLMPEARGQARGNSGVFSQDVYEVQVLDSYGLDGNNNECGGMYKVSPPQVNACAPPLEWQTYDITFHGAKYDAEGKVAEFPRITVYQNGILIQHDIPLPWITQWKEEQRLQPPPKEAESIRLQAHHNFVQYRNMWVVELPE